MAIQAQRLADGSVALQVNDELSIISAHEWIKLVASVTAKPRQRTFERFAEMHMNLSHTRLVEAGFGSLVTARRA